MTEDEAKTRWCPFARVAAPEGPAFNRSVGGMGTHGINTIDPPSLCIGSACMAWRGLGWVPVDLVRAARTENGLSFDEAVALVREQVGREDGQHGFCGLAGAPQ